MRDDMQVVIRAKDEFSATMQKVSASTGRLDRELHKLSDSSEYVAGGLRRVRNIMEGMAFGVVAGAVSAVTQEFINAWTRAFNVEEIMNKLNDTVRNQATAWNLLPQPMGAVAQSTIDVYNAQLALSKFYAISQIPKFKKEIDDLNEANKMAAAEMYRNTQLFGPYSAGLFNAEILNKKNTETILTNNVAIAEKSDKLRQLLEVQGLQPTAIEKVTVSTKAAAIIRKMDQEDEKWWADWRHKMTLEAIEREDAKSKAYERNRLVITAVHTEYVRLIGTTDDYYDSIRREKQELSWSAAQIEAYIIELKRLDETRKQMTAQQALAGLEEKSPYGFMANLKEAADLNEIAQLALQQQTKLDMMTAYNAAVIQTMIDAKASQQDIEARWTDLSIQYTQQEAYVKYRTIATLAGQLGAMSAQMYNAMGGKAKAAFYASKLLAVAQIIINTEVAAARVAAEGGLFLGLPLAALVKASGYASAAMVAAMTIGSQPSIPGGVSGGGGMTPSSIGSTPGSTPTSLTTREEVKPTQNIEIKVYALDPSSVNWNKIVENNIAPAMKSASDRNVAFNIKVVQN
jgi:hypothetical protein